MGSSTADLIFRLAGPDGRGAWDELARRHGADVWRVIGSRLHDAHEAEDAYQEFWTALPGAARCFTAQASDSERKARAWLMHIAYTTAIAQVRRRSPAAALDTAGSDVEVEMDGRTPDEELFERVRAGMRRLSEEQRQPLLLHIVGGLTYDELAAELRCTGQNARVKVHRALKRLRELAGVPELPEQAIAGAMVPPLLLPALPAFAAAPATTTAGGAAGTAAAVPAATAAGPLAVLTQVPVLIGAGAAVAATVTAAAVITLSAPSGDPMPAIPAATALLAASALTAAVVDDFERPEHGMTSTGQDKVGCTLTLVDAPAGSGGGSGKALQMAWPSPHGKWVEVGYAKALPALTATADEPLVATVKLWCEGFSGAKRLSTRFTDAKGETFQWRTAIPEQGSTGWRSVATAIDWATPQTSWGSNADKRIDWPVHFSGLAIEFDSKDIPAAAVIVDDIAIAPAAK
jgi:RNA polymerase sigma factor (sigma-70 family)